MFYGSITKAVPVGDIKTAEMAKIIENTQRALNISLMNEVVFFDITLPSHCLPKIIGVADSDQIF